MTQDIQETPPLTSQSLARTNRRVNLYHRTPRGSHQEGATQVTTHVTIWVTTHITTRRSPTAVTSSTGNPTKDSTRHGTPSLGRSRKGEKADGRQGVAHGVGGPSVKWEKEGVGRSNPQRAQETGELS